MIPEKTCYNCKFFVRHYEAACGAYLPVNCGRCTHPRLLPKAKRNCPRVRGCASWEPAAVGNVNELRFDFRDARESVEEVVIRLKDRK